MLVPLIFKFSLGAFYRDDEQRREHAFLNHSGWLETEGPNSAAVPHAGKQNKANRNPAARFPRSMWKSTDRLASFKCPQGKSSRLRTTRAQNSEGILPVQTDVLHQGGGTLLTGAHHHGVTRETSSPQIGLID